MPSIADLMTNDHRSCDDEFARVEAAVAKKDWASAASECSEFAAAMERHFNAEESQLFPAFELATGMSGGPTSVMRGEHKQIRQLLEDMESAIVARREGDFCGSAETLLLLMQQHNMKEENILYAMCDDHLQPQAAGLCASLSETIGRVHA